MAGNFISSVSSEEFDKALLGGLDAANGKFAKKEEIPTVPKKVSELENDAGYLKSFAETDPTVPAWAKTPEKPEYTAKEVGARPDSWTPSAAEVGADPAGTADAAVSNHNVDADAHNDIRLLIEGLASRLNALADSDDTTLDQMSEIVAYIKANKTLIDSITTSKVNVSDIINNLTTNVSNKPLSAAQGVILKGLIDSLSTGKLDVTAIADWAKAATKPSYTKSEVGLGNVDNVKQYSASNPPPYPVTSVNGSTGAVTVAVPEVVQTIGTSTTNIMSQKAVTDALVSKSQLTPEFANSIEDCTDTSKLYVLPDGYIYAYMYSEVAVGGYTNMVDPSSSDFQADKRYNASGAITSSSYDKGNCFVSNAFDIKAGDIVRIRGVARSENSNATAPIFGMAGLLSDGENYSAAHFSYLGQPVGATPAAYQQCWNAYQTLADGTLEWVFAVNNAGENRAVAYSTIAKTRVAGVATNGIANVIVTVNEEIIEPSIVKDYQWTNTGHAFVPADYEDRILALEAEDVKIHAEIENLQDQIDSGAASAKSGARWFALGDSITEGWVSAVDEAAESGYKQYLNTNIAERWVNIVAEKNGYELTNYGVGGTGYAHAKTGAVNARAQVANIDFSQCDFVTLAYGVNDWKGKATLGSMDDDVDTVDAFVPNMRYVIKKILADNPYCKIFVITPINCRSLGSYATNYGINYANDTYASGPGLEQIFELEKAVCDYHGIELIDMTHSAIVNRENITTMLPDHVHPTVECHAVMARELAKKIAFA